MNVLTIKKLKSTDFPEIYKKFLLNVNINNNDYVKILSIAIIFINSENIYIQRLGYRIVVIYSNRTQNFAPLYEIAINKGLYPIVKFIDNKYTANNKNFFTELNSSFLECFKVGNMYFSKKQYEINQHYDKNSTNSVAIVAPTSYGKSELIIKSVKESKNKNIVVITPTKSLLMQTKKRIIDEKIEWIKKIIVHPEMYSQSDSNCIAILTQERLLRLLKNNHDLKFDCVIVDEAHELFENDEREELLASVIIILNKRNASTAFKFLTPFIKETNNLKIKYTSYDLKEYIVDEHIKTEKIYLFDPQKSKNLSFYDQYLNTWYDLDFNISKYNAIQFILQTAGRKNIIYFNKPKHIEDFAKKLIDALPDIVLSETLSKAIDNISNYINPDYLLIKAIKKGFIYHHGCVTDIIRSYIENLYNTCEEIKIILTSSTLLEGVNIPASKIYVMDNKKGNKYLSASAFKNLIGRVCRFKEIFNNENGSLKLLEPEIYIVIDKYYQKNINIQQFISNTMKIDKKIEDDVSNVLLENAKKDENYYDNIKNACEYLENFEQGLIPNYKERKAKTILGKSCLENNIKFFDVFENEKEMYENLDSLISFNGLINSSDTLLEYINNIFIKYIPDNKDNQDIVRLKKIEARKYYKMFLNWRINSIPFSKMVTLTTRYWKDLCNYNKNTIIYVGSWGDLTDRYHYEFWTDVSKKSKEQLINLAIVRIKIEQDFVDNTLMSFFEVLNDLKALESNFYKKLKYGTDDDYEVILIKNGLSLSLTKLLLDKYKTYLNIDIHADIANINPCILEEMKKNNENEIFINEMKNNVF